MIAVVRTVIGFLGLGLAVVAGADILEINPGKWRSTTVVKTSMSDPQTGTDVRCIEQTGIDPLAAIGNDGTCEASDVAQSSTSFSANVLCETNGMEMTGQIAYAMSGDTFTGSFSMQMAEVFSMEGNIEGERIGDCD